MPMTPNDMSDAAVKKRAEFTAESRALAKAKAAEPVAAPKPRIAKKR